MRVGEGTNHGSLVFPEKKKNWALDFFLVQKYATGLYLAFFSFGTIGYLLDGPAKLVTREFSFDLD